MAEELTPQQAQAVRERGGKLLVSAAAGSGKTKVLVDRLLGYLTDPVDPANIDDFLVITYTKAAAAELRGKIAAKISERIAQEPENRHLQRQMQRLYLAKISTVHAFCGDILREYLYQLDISADFRMADETECAELRERVMTQLLDEAYAQEEADEDFLAFVDTQGLGRSDDLVPQIIQRVYDSARCHIDPDAWLERCLSDAQTAQVADASETVWGRYLMDDLFSYLDLQIPAIAFCVQRLEAEPALTKPAALFKELHSALLQLRGCKTWDAVSQSGKIDFGRLTFPRNYENPELTETVKAIRSDCKERLFKKLESFRDSGTQVMEDLAQSAPAVRGMIALVRKFAEGYERVKRSYRLLDFGDLEHKALDLLLGKHRTGPTAAAREIGGRFREILVDEYQDSNAVQDAIFTALTQTRQNLFMVGDVKQAIYQFRLADPGIFLSRYENYVPAEQAQPGQGRKVLLSSNFRSGGGVISAVNDVFSCCMSPEVGQVAYTESEALREGIPHAPLSEPEVELHTIAVRQDTYAEEADFVAKRIAALLDGSHMVRGADGLRPIRPEDIVILLRSPDSTGDQFLYALGRHGIRGTAGGGVDLLKTEEVGTLRSLLQTLSNPRQDIPLLAVLASPLFGYTADELAGVRRNDRSGAFYDALLKDDSEKSREVCRLLAALRQDVRMRSLTGLLENIFIETPLVRAYGAMPGGKEKSDNLQAFFQLAMDFESRGGKDLERFLEHLDASAEKKLTVPGEQTQAGAVGIMSIHKSKGLEFPVVFLCGLSRRFNRESLNAQVLCHKDMGIGVSCVDRKNRVRYPTISKRAIAAKMASESLSEEMRVLYVAMTRAKDRLIMTFAHGNLEDKVQDIARRMDGCDRRLMASGVNCPGEWVLQAALRRSEAGALFRLGRQPAETTVSEFPWVITASEMAAVEDGQPVSAEKPEVVPETDFPALRESLFFRYAHQAATAAPSKQTATQRKGRLKDQEAAQDAQEPKTPHRVWRKPTFAGKAVQGKEYGDAIHASLQFIRYEACTDAEAVKNEISRLVNQGFLTAEQGNLVNCDQIASFFETPLGIRLRGEKNVLREFKFSILDDAASYAEGLEGERILLQGVVDCALIEDDGITILDFKTDYVTKETLPVKTAHYRPQVEAYASALSRIFALPVKRQYLYFFHLGQLVSTDSAQI